MRGCGDAPCTIRVLAYVRACLSTEADCGDCGGTGQVHPAGDMPIVGGVVAQLAVGVFAPGVQVSIRSQTEGVVVPTGAYLNPGQSSWRVLRRSNPAGDMPIVGGVVAQLAIVMGTRVVDVSV